MPMSACTVTYFLLQVCTYSMKQTPPNNAIPYGLRVNMWFYGKSYLLQPPQKYKWDQKVESFSVVVLSCLEIVAAKRKYELGRLCIFLGIYE